MDFRNTILIMTSNMGSDLVLRSDGSAIGFQSTVDSRTESIKLREKVLAELRKHCRPEFLNRIDSVVVFRPLSRNDLIPIVGLHIASLAARLSKRALTLELTEEATCWLAEVGYDPAFGARPLRRWIETELESVIARKLLAKEFPEGVTLEVALVAGALDIRAI